MTSFQRTIPSSHPSACPLTSETFRVLRELIEHALDMSSKMAPTSTRRSNVRPILGWTGACALIITVFVYYFGSGIPRLHQHAFDHLRPPPSPPADQPETGSQVDDCQATFNSWAFDHRRDSKNYGLSESQCSSAFPLLGEEIDRAVDYRRRVGNITVEEVEDAWRQNEAMRVLIHENQLYIVNARGLYSAELRLRSLATLNSLNRAVTSYSGRLPTVEFTISVGDSPQADRANDFTALAYSRRSNQESLWLMPGYGFWSSPANGMRSYASFRSIIIDSDQDFLDKVPKLVWRGTLGTDDGADARKALAKESHGQSWSDVRVVDWSNQTSAEDVEDVEEDLISMEDHCSYMFAVETEDNSHAGRLKYLLNCNNVVMTPEFSWIEHFHHLLAPSGDYQNYVKLKRDFSDLRTTMRGLVEPSRLQNTGRLIADNARKMFRERYLTPAAESCYWRDLIRGWASIQDFEPQVWIESEEPDWHIGSGTKVKRKPRGTLFESYTLMKDV